MLKPMESAETVEFRSCPRFRRVKEHLGKVPPWSWESHGASFNVDSLLSVHHVFSRLFLIYRTLWPHSHRSLCPSPFLCFFLTDSCTSATWFVFTGSSMYKCVFSEISSWACLCAKGFLSSFHSGYSYCTITVAILMLFVHNYLKEQ